MTKRIAETVKTPETLLITGKVGDEDKAIALFNTTLEQAPVVIKSLASNAFQNAYSPNISVRDGFDRWDYENFRVDERIPTDDKGKVLTCMSVYKESGFGLIRNIIDLMAELVVEGIDVVHKKKKNEKFAKAWFNKTVKGPVFSERFTNLLCRTGNNFVKRDTKQIPLNKVRKYYKGEAGNDTDGITYNDEPYKQEMEVVKRTIPIRYTLLNPAYIEVYSPELTMFINNSDMRYAIELPKDLIRRVNNPIYQADKALIGMLPNDILTLLQKNERLLPLDPTRVDSYYYKKDDWEVWATPMIYGVLSDLYQLRKMKLADLSAIDGVLSQIRLWKLGQKDSKIRPSLSAMNRLASLLTQGVAGGIMDIIWGPDIEVQEISSDLHQYLGESKYVPTLKAIYEGLGVPPLFTGGSSQGSYTNNFLSIKTFIVRLQYLRECLRTFWNKEFEILQKALDWDDPPVLVFDRMTLNDEAGVLQVLLHMVDRGILSDEAMQEMVGAIPEIEQVRIKREWQDRKRKRTPPKASQFHKPDFENTWLDSFIKLGEVTPSQVGLELEENKEGEKTPNQSKVDLGIQGPKAKSDLGGRPPGVKDKAKRKTKVLKPKKGIAKLIQNITWAQDAQLKINDIVTPLYLSSLEKKNLRQLTDEEFNNLEQLKLGLLANIPLNTTVDESLIKDAIVDKKIEISQLFSDLLASLVRDQEEKLGSKLTIDIIRRMQSIAYATYFYEDEEE